MTPAPTSQILAAARAAHEANLAYCMSIGDDSQMPWELAPKWQQDSAIAGVHGVLRGNSPEQSHEGWMALKLREGWTYGAVKDADKKTHPCLLPYSQLPAEQRVKDSLFVAVVKAVLDTYRQLENQKSHQRKLEQEQQRFASQPGVEPHSDAAAYYNK